MVSSLGACVSVPAAKNYREQSLTVADFSIPQLGTVTEVSVGEILLTQGEKRVAEAIELQSSAYRPHNGTSNLYVKSAESDEYDWYIDSNSSVFTDKGGLATNGITIKKQKGSGYLCPFQITGGGYSAGYNCYKEAKYTMHDSYTITSINSFQRSLIYNGKSGSKINIAYREFSNSLARPAFSNNVEYDMSESNIIAYKGAELKILEYTNTKIKYEVIKNFNSQ